MARALAFVLLVLLVACRHGFEAARDGGGGGGGDGEMGDAEDLGPCVTDDDCGRCQRCTNLRCERATFTKVDLGQRHSCALDERGQVWCWGFNAYGGVAADVDPTLTIPRPRRRGDAIGLSDIRVGYGFLIGRTVQSRLDGHGLWWYPAPPSGDPIWTAIYAHHFTACAIDTSGRLFCVGDGESGQLGRAVLGEPREPFGQFGADSDWASVATGGHVCAIKVDGRLFCVGSNVHGQLGRGTTTAYELTIAQVGTATDWAQVVAGEELTCARKLDGSLWCWGMHLPSGATVTVPTRVGTESDWTSLVAYGRCACATRATSEVHCACTDSTLALAVLGERAPDWARIPLDIEPGTFAVGGDVGCARSAGVWSCFGDNVFRAVGIGDVEGHVAPTPLCE